MKITKEVEVTVCDICKKEGMIAKRGLCNKEVCGEHWYNIKTNVKASETTWRGSGIILLVCMQCLRNNSVALLNHFNFERKSMTVVSKEEPQ